MCVLLEGRKFTKFRCKNDNFIAGVCLEDLYKLVKSSSKSDNMVMYVDEMSIDKLSFMFSNQEKNKISKASLNLLDIDKLHIPLTIVCDVAITMNASDFRDICKEMSNITQDLEILCTRKSITFVGKGDSSKQEITYHTNENTGLKIKMNSDVKNPIVQGIYPLRYLLTISKCANICKFAILRMKNRNPLFIEYSVATLGSIRVAITPKIRPQLDDNEKEE
jgi:proliferating cell nuclear antigen PCNA